jgi:hypothetical protein
VIALGTVNADLAEQTRRFLVRNEFGHCLLAESLRNRDDGLHNKLIRGV